MEQVVSEPCRLQNLVPPTELPADISDWPEEARTAYRGVQRELDSWCRRHGWTTSRNAWVAEEAVRQCW